MLFLNWGSVSRFISSCFQQPNLTTMIPHSMEIKTAQSSSLLLLESILERECVDRIYCWVINSLKPLSLKMNDELIMVSFYYLCCSLENLLLELIKFKPLNTCRPHSFLSSSCRFLGSICCMHLLVQSPSPWLVGSSVDLLTHPLSHKSKLRKNMCKTRIIIKTIMLSSLEGIFSLGFMGAVDKLDCFYNVYRLSV